jgi:MFS family permease
MTFSAIVGSSYFWLMCQEHMRFSKLATNMLFQVIGPVASILAAPLWGRMIDRWGRRPVLIVATVMGVGSLLPWLLVTPQLHGPQWLADGLNSVASAVGGVFGWHGTAIDQSAPLGAYLLAAVGCIIGGTSWTGIGIAQFGIVLGFSDGHGRSKFVAASSVLISFGGIAGGLCGGWIADALAAYKWDASPWRVGIFEWTNYHATMLAAVFARATAALWLVGMPEPGAKSVRDVVRYMRINVQNAVTTYLFYPMRVFGYGRERGSSASQGPAAPPPAEPISRQQRRDD